MTAERDDSRDRFCVRMFKSCAVSGNQPVTTIDGLDEIDVHIFLAAVMWQLEYVEMQSLSGTSRVDAIDKVICKSIPGQNNLSTFVFEKQRYAAAIGCDHGENCGGEAGRAGGYSEGAVQLQRLTYFSISCRHMVYLEPWDLLGSA